MGRLSRWTEGYRLTAGIVAVVGVVVASLAFHSGVHEAELRLATRLTVGVGAVVFSVVFAASSLHAHRILRGPSSKWLLRNRRYLGLAFAGIHFLHAGCFLTLAFGYPASFWRTTSLVTVLGGSVGYLWVVAMTVTSFDGPTRAIGKVAWRRLHRSGMYVLWGILVFSYVPKILRAPAYGLLVSLLLSGFALRLLAAPRLGVRTR